MKTVSLSGSLRENVGKKDAKQHRKEGKFPCVIYGGKEQVHFTLDRLAFDKVLFTPDVYVIKIELDGKTYETILQDIQYHPTTDEVLHVDFLELVPGKPVTIGLPVSLTGKAPGVVKGGKLRLKLRKLKVKGLIEKMPETIEVSVSKLDIGRAVKVKDVSVEGLQFLDPASNVIVTVKTARGIVAGEEEEEEEGEEAAGDAAETPAAE
ncbi:MAG: 50S ribosomal protein L25/general stress protein Ctc [Bacteroidales bacterium]|nr:50S ribosomal protein L25/general stress protein Ctc [Bacteroidales bacterium]